MNRLIHKLFKKRQINNKEWWAEDVICNNCKKVTTLPEPTHWDQTVKCSRCNQYLTIAGGTPWGEIIFYNLSNERIKEITKNKEKKNDRFTRH